MATSKVKVILNTASPEATKDQIVAEFKNRDANAAVEIIRDSFGKVVAVHLDNVLENAADQARVAVLANKGVATISPVIPQQLIITDLDDIAGISSTTPIIPGRKILVLPATKQGFLGILPSSGYVDGEEFPEGTAPFFVVLNEVGEDFVITPGMISIKYNGISTLLAIANTNNIVAVAGYARVYFITVTGKIYLHGVASNMGFIEGPYTFEEAVANGAV